MKTFIATIITPLIIFVAFFCEEGKQMYLTPHVEHYIQQVSHLPSETVACLDYAELNGDVYVYDYEIPKTYAIGTTWVKAEQCKENQVRFHNHPYQHADEVTDYYKKATGKDITSKNQLIYLSRPDIWNTIFSRTKYVMVGSNGNYGWWERTQISNDFMQLPIKGQITTTDSTLVYDTQ